MLYSATGDFLFALTLSFSLDTICISDMTYDDVITAYNSYLAALFIV